MCVSEKERRRRERDAFVFVYKVFQNESRSKISESSFEWRRPFDWQCEEGGHHLIRGNFMIYAMSFVIHKKTTLPRMSHPFARSSQLSYTPTRCCSHTHTPKGTTTARAMPSSDHLVSLTQLTKNFFLDQPSSIMTTISEIQEQEEDMNKQRSIKG